MTFLTTSHKNHLYKDTALETVTDSNIVEKTVSWAGVVKAEDAENVFGGDHDEVEMCGDKVKDPGIDVGMQ